MSRTKYLGILLALAVIMAVPIIAVAAQPAQSSPLTITLNPLNDSGESGTAVLTDLGNGQIKVDLTLSGEPADATQPVHIHSGQCGATLGPVVYPLTNVVNGTSTTTITATMSSLMDGNHAINGHKSSTDMTTYVFCGNIPSAAASTPVTSAATAAATPAASATVASTATTAATTAATPAASANVTSTTSAATPAASSTPAPPSTAPTTGGDLSGMLMPALLFGLVMLLCGLLARRLAIK